MTGAPWPRQARHQAPAAGPEAAQDGAVMAWRSDSAEPDRAGDVERALDPAIGALALAELDVARAAGQPG